MVDIGALNLAHRDEVVSQQLTIVCADSADFSKALISEEGKFLTCCLELLGFISKHESESDVLVLLHLFGSADELVLSALELPLGEVFFREEAFFLVIEILFFLDVVDLGLVTNLKELTERLVFMHVVLKVAAEIDLNQITKVSNMIAATRHHLGKPREKFLLSVALDHPVQLCELLKELAEIVH